jgi:hypothetical protein
MDDLTAEIADLARQGLSVRQMAVRLGVSEARIASALDGGTAGASPSPDEVSDDSFPASDPPPGPATP